MILRHTLAPLLAAAALLLAALPASAASPDLCPRDGAPVKRVYMIGSSTMGSVLGPMLQRLLEDEHEIRSKRWGKASSGLARPDFHDWISLAPGLMKRHRPQVVVISLGTNDAQPLYSDDGWTKTDNDKWPERYGQRVAKLLEKVAGADRQRSIIWLGPTSFDAGNSRRLGPVISRVIREQIEAFEGRAVYVDSYADTTNSRGKSIETFDQPGMREPQPARTDDGIHLTTDAVRWLLAEPVMELLEPCFAAAAEETVAEPSPAEEEAAEEASEGAGG